MAGPLRNDLDVGVSDIRIGFDGEIVERNDAPYKKDDRETKHQDAIVQREINQVTNHLLRRLGLEELSRCVPEGYKLFYREGAWGRATQTSRGRGISIAA
jgi:hypothetical protein